MKFKTAMKHRKLFPDENSTYTPQTADCTFCDPGCPPDTCIPIFFPPPPPLSPPPPPPPPHNHPVSPYLIIFVCLVFGFFLVILFNVIRAKIRHVNQAPANNNGPQRQAPSDGSEEEELVDQRHHHIWFISTVGLQPSVINSISVCKYKRGEGLIEGTECSVCLNEFQEDETLRLLPKCSHAFHISCIDTWLKSHTNCPMCRARIVSSSESSPPPTAAAQNPDISAVMANTQIGNPATETLVGENRERNGENRAGTEEGGGAERIMKQSVNSTPVMTRYVSFDSSMAESGEFSVEDGEEPSTSRQQTGGGGGGCSSVVLPSVCVKAQSP